MTTVITISMRHEMYPVFKSLEQDFDSDLSKCVVALVKYWKKRTDNRKMKEEIKYILRNG